MAELEVFVDACIDTQTNSANFAYYGNAEKTKCFVWNANIVEHNSTDCFKIDQVTSPTFPFTFESLVFSPMPDDTSVSLSSLTESSIVLGVKNTSSSTSGTRTLSFSLVATVDGVCYTSSDPQITLEGPPG